MGFTLDSLRLTVINESNKRGEFKIGPLHKGYGITLGNALRRVLLSSIQGTAVIAVHIDGIFHQFTSIPGVLEDGIQIVANIKNLVLKSDIEDRKVLSITRNKQAGPIKAGDLVTPPSVEIVNKDLVIANVVDDDVKFSMNLYVEKGIEYLLADEIQSSSFPIGTFPIDALFCPVTHVSYTVKQSMFKESLDYEMLYVIVETNGAIEPLEAYKNSAQILVDYFSSIVVEKELIEPVIEIAPKETDEILKKPLEDVIPLSVRTGNVFKKANIYSVQDLFCKSKKDLLSLKNFGMKSLTQTLEELLKVPEIERLKSRVDLELINEIVTGGLLDEQEELMEEAEEILEKDMVHEETVSDKKKKEESKVDPSILNKVIEEVAEEIEISEPQFIRLKKYMVDTIEHLTHMNKEDLLTGNNKLSKKNVDRLEQYLHQHNLKFKD
jgi:DNA-directed RNA polymerase subunit alpha